MFSVLIFKPWTFSICPLINILFDEENFNKKTLTEISTTKVIFLAYYTTMKNFVKNYNCTKEKIKEIIINNINTHEI